jgi:hypothetical protein
MFFFNSTKFDHFRLELNDPSTLCKINADLQNKTTLSYLKMRNNCITTRIDKGKC